VTNTEDLQETATSQIGSEDRQITNLMNTVNPGNPLNFHFEANLADRQRRQYESEIMGRKKKPNRYHMNIHPISIVIFLNYSSSIGGVFLRASHLDGTIPYPTLQVIKSKISIFSFCL
jgi:hypothetical protein